MRLSIVTPSFNHDRFIQETLKSIHSDKCGDFEHIVIDGGSTDKTCDIIRGFERELSYWVSEPDDGQYDAINKGFARSTGDIMGWLNSDDVYYPWTIRTVRDIFQQFPQVEWLTTRCPSAVNDRGVMIRMPETCGFDRASFRKGFNLTGAGWPADIFIQQESTFWRRSLWERAGSKVDASLRYAGDFELWLRFFDRAELYAVDVPLAGFRKHSDQKTSRAFASYVSEAVRSLEAAGCVVPDPVVMKWQVEQRRNPDSREALVLAGLADRAPLISYDWASGSWLVK